MHLSVRVLLSALCALLLLWAFPAASQPAFLSRALINISTATDTTLVTGVAGVATKVYGIEYFVNGAQTITLKCATTTVLPAQAFATNTGVIRDQRGRDPWFACAAGENLIMTTSAAVQVSGNVYYLQN